MQVVLSLRCNKADFQRVEHSKFIPAWVIQSGKVRHQIVGDLQVWRQREHCRGDTLNHENLDLHETVAMLGNCIETFIQAALLMFGNVKDSLRNRKPRYPEDRLGDNVVAENSRPEIVDEYVEVDGNVNAAEEILHDRKHPGIRFLTLLEYIQMARRIHHGWRESIDVGAGIFFDERKRFFRRQMHLCFEKWQ